MTMAGDRVRCQSCGRPSATTADLQRDDPGRFDLCWRAVFSFDSSCLPRMR